MEDNSTKNEKSGSSSSYDERVPDNSKNSCDDDTHGNSTSGSSTGIDSGACSGTRGHTGTPNDLGTNGLGTPEDGTHDHGANSGFTGKYANVQSHAMPRDEALLNESSSVPGTSTMTRVGSVSNLETQLVLRNHVREKKDVEKLGEMVPIAAKPSEEELLTGRQGLSLPEVHAEPPPVVPLGSLSEQTGTALRTKRAEKQIATDAAFAELLTKKLKLSEAKYMKSSVSSPLRRKSKSISLREAEECWAIHLNHDENTGSDAGGSEDSGSEDP